MSEQQDFGRGEKIPTLTWKFSIQMLHRTSPNGQPASLNSMSGVSDWNMKKGLSTSTVGPSLRWYSPQQAQPARWQRGFCNAWRENWRKRTEASTLLQWRGFVVGFLLLCCVVQSFAFAEVGPTASIPSTQNESWPLWRAEWRFTNLLHAACPSFFSWFPFPSYSFPHSDLYLHVLLDSYIGVIFSTYRYALTSWFYPAHFWAYARTRTPAHVYPAHTHAHTFPRPVDSSAILLLLFLSNFLCVFFCMCV